MKIKIPVRLKISVRSENPYLKISVHQWASRPEWCKCSGHLKGLQAAPDAKQESDKGRAGEDAGTHDHRKREDSGNTGGPEYICMIAGNEKKYKKS